MNYASRYSFGHLGLVLLLSFAVALPAFGTEPPKDGGESKPLPAGYPGVPGPDPDAPNPPPPRSSRTKDDSHIVVGAVAVLCIAALTLSIFTCNPAPEGPDPSEILKKQRLDREAAEQAALDREKDARFIAEDIQRLGEKKDVFWADAKTFDDYLVAIAKELKIDETQLKAWRDEAKDLLSKEGMRYENYKPRLQSTGEALAATALQRAALKDASTVHALNAGRLGIRSKLVAFAAPFAGLFFGQEAYLAVENEAAKLRVNSGQHLTEAIELQTRSVVAGQLLRARLATDRNIPTLPSIGSLWSGSGKKEEPKK